MVARCQHHWLIEPPQGPSSQGRCKKCGTERQFLNSLSDEQWRHDSDYWRWGNPGEQGGQQNRLPSGLHLIDEEKVADAA